MSRVMMRFGGAAALALFAAACDQTPVDLPVETELVLGTEAVTLHVGQSTAVSAVVVDQSGVALRNAEVRWATSNAAVAVVGQTGTVSGQAEGEAEIIATYGSLTASIPVTVQREDRTFVQKVEFIDEGGSYHKDHGTVQLGLRVLNGQGRMVDCFNTNSLAISAASSNPAVASVLAVPTTIANCRLEVTLNQAGTATITLTVNGASTSYELTVTDEWFNLAWVAGQSANAVAGDTVTLRAIVTNEKGEPVAGKMVHFDREIGTMLETEAVTDVNGIASARWAVPPSLRHLGVGAYDVSIAIDNGAGTSFGTTRPITVARGKPASLQFYYEDPDNAGRYLLISNTSLTVETGTTSILVVAYDKHGNIVASSTGNHTIDMGGTATANTPGTHNFVDYWLNASSRLINVNSATAQSADLDVELEWAVDSIKLTKKLTLNFVDPS